MDNGASSYRRYLDGDDEGIAEIVREYREGLILFLQSFVSDLHTAEDLAEDTFFRLMIRRPRFLEKCKFKTWIYSIARNVAVDWVRKNKWIADKPVEDMAYLLADETDLEQSYIKEERRIMVHRSLAKLSSEYRQVIWLIYFEELSHEDIGKIMDKSPRQIRNLLYRAKQTLKAVLLKEGFDDEEFR
ncbi:MAG: RNA polymerase sigma factor [Lachnospiraceae bacterium]|nr:RNA polymerase sigma factor [Lachnospiraceae bacterium]